MAWTVDYSELARRQIRNLDRPTARRIRNYIVERIATLDNPRLRGQALSGDLSGLWRYRVGNYRVICDIQDDVLVVLVVEVGHRGQVYR